MQFLLFATEWAICLGLGNSFFIGGIDADAPVSAPKCYEFCFHDVEPFLHCGYHILLGLEHLSKSLDGPVLEVDAVLELCRQLRLLLRLKFTL